MAAWLLRPRGAEGPLPVVVTYIGYSGGRGLPTSTCSGPRPATPSSSSTPAARATTPRTAATGDGTQWAEGFMTRGIDSPEHYYYRRLMTDCVRAVDAVARAARPSTRSGSSSPAAARAAASPSPSPGWSPDRVAAVLPDVPFLCHFRRAAGSPARGRTRRSSAYLRWHSRHRVAADLRHARLLRRRPLRPAGDGAGTVQRRPDGPDLPALHRLRRLQPLRGRRTGP